MKPKPPAPPEPVFFDGPPAFRRWLEKNHASQPELLLGFHHKKAGAKTFTYHQALDEALCFGWIDGVRRSLDRGRWTVRFTPRKPRSVWSLVNIRHVERLKKEGRMAPPGLKAFDGRDRTRSGLYSFEQKRAIALDRESTRTFKANPAAWTFFRAQPPGYRRTATFWVMSAKKPETRHRRLKQLVDDSASGRRLAMLARPAREKP